MASQLYTPFKTALLNKQIDMVNDTINIVLVDSASYTPNMSTHDFLNDIASGARINAPVSLSSKTVVSGVFDADDVTFPAVSGSPLEYVVLYKHTGNDGTANLICLFDTGSGLPFTPSGSGSVLLRFDNGPNKIFAL